MNQPYDIAVVGGGAAGLAAAVMCARMAVRPLRTVILERGNRVGRKLAATGNGTCNLTNCHAAVNRYHGSNPLFVAPLLERFSPVDACRFFEAIGVICETRESGRVYPLCEQAGAVLDCLRLAARSKGVEERCMCEVTALRRADGRLVLQMADDSIEARRVLVCTGGTASPSLGGGASGYALLTEHGHHRTSLFPSIVQLRTDPTYVKAMKGLRVNATCVLRCGETERARETGEILFTDYGLSGPAVMQISRAAADWERKKQGTMTAVLDLLPDWECGRVKHELERRTTLQERTLENLFTGWLNKRVGQTVLRMAGVLPLSRPCGQMTTPEIERLIKTVKGMTFTVLGTQGMAGAQVTAGGLVTEEFDPDTLESRWIPGVYAAGEILDIDGDCGGFNLQFAWSGAYTAARAMVRSLAADGEQRG